MIFLCLENISYVAESLNHEVCLTTLQMSKKGYCSNYMESSDVNRWINFMSPCTLDRLAEHLLTPPSGFQLLQVQSSIPIVLILYCNNEWETICLRRTGVDSRGRGF